jgi:hypothetical protein
LVHGEKVYMGADSISLIDDEVHPQSDQKIYRVGEFLFGSIGNTTIRRHIQHGFQPPSIEHPDLMAYMVLRFTPALRRFLAGVPGVEHYADGGRKLMVGVRGRLFSFAVKADYLDLSESTRGYDAIGYGQAHAMACLHVTEPQEWPPQARLEKALETAEVFNCYVRSPFRFLHA